MPAVYNGVATGADWMSAASFISMAGSLYALGYDGLGYVLGWTGGYVLGMAILLAPYLRKFGIFTVPDFLGTRYEGHLPRLLAIIVLFCASFTYIVAQIVGVGIVGLAFPADSVRRGGLRGPRRDPGVLDAGRHAGGDLDTGRAVHHPDHRLYPAGGDPVGATLRRADPGLTYGQALQRIGENQAGSTARRMLAGPSTAQLLRSDPVPDDRHRVAAAS